MQRVKKAMKNFKIITERVLQDCRPKIDDIPDIKANLENLMYQTEHLLTRDPKDINQHYSLHEAEVLCNRKGKAHRKYAFNSKVSLSLLNRGAGIMMGYEFLSGALYNCYTFSKHWISPGKSGGLRGAACFY